MIPLFLHLPKTGGTTLNNCICGQYYTGEAGAAEGQDPYFKGGIYYFPTGFFQGQGPPCADEIRAILQREDLRAVVGHFGFGLHRLLRKEADFGYLTLVRSPAERIASLYRHIAFFDKPDPDLHREVIASGISLHEFASSFPLLELENDQTRRIAGVPGPCTSADLERAKERLVNDFTFVGLTERFDESVVLLKRRLGWRKPLQYYPENVSADLRMPPAPLDAGTVAVIHERNAYDLELHAFARELFDQARAKELASGFDEEVAAFRRHNREMMRHWRRE